MRICFKWAMGNMQKALFQIRNKRRPVPRGKSHLEEGLAQQIQFEELPVPHREYVFHPTRKWRFDFCWPDRKLAVELEGGIFIAGRHNRPISMEGDMEKYNAATLLGWRVGRFSRRMVENGAAMRWILEMFE